MSNFFVGETSSQTPFRSVETLLDWVTQVQNSNSFLNVLAAAAESEFEFGEQSTHAWRQAAPGSAVRLAGAANEAAFIHAARRSFGETKVEPEDHAPIFGTRAVK